MTSSWLLYNLSKSCSLLVHDLITTCSWLFHDLFISWSQLVNKFFMTCSWFDLVLFMTCSQFDLYLFMSSSLLFFSFHGLPLIHSWLIHNFLGLVHELSVTCSWLITCSWLVLYLSMTFLWLVHELFIIFHDSSMACSQLVLKFQHNLLFCLTLSASFFVTNGYHDMRGTSCHMQDTSPSLPWCLGWCHG